MIGRTGNTKADPDFLVFWGPQCQVLKPFQLSFPRDDRGLPDSRAHFGYFAFRPH
jgi:hypothetical protein